MFRKIALCLCFTLFLGLVTACSPKGILHPNTSESPHQNQPQTSENGKNAGNTNPSDPSDSAAGHTASEITAPIAIPPAFGGSDPYAKPGEAGIALAPQSTIPGLQPMKGVNVDTLFAEKLKNSDDRFARLENTVLEMRKEMSSVMPSIIRLVAIEGDIQNLTQELEGILQETPPQDAYQPTNLMSGYSDEDANLEVSQLNPQPHPPDDDPPTLQAEKPMPPPQAAKPVSAPSAPQPVKKAPAHNGAKTSSALRLGEYNDKVRIVIDTNQKPNVTADYDPEENLVVLEVMDAKWIGEMQKTFASSKLVQSYSVSERPDGQGATIAITLKKATKIIKQGTVDPDDNPNYRFYLDLSL